MPIIHSLNSQVMQLLYSRAAPSPEFVSLSLLLKGEINGDDLPTRMREPLLLSSPVSTISQSTCVEAVQELHRYLVTIHRATRPTNNDTDHMTSALLKEDERLLVDSQVYRPSKGQGIGLHYKHIRERSAVSPLVKLILRAISKGPDNNKSTQGVEKDVVGVVLCVGMAGLPSTFVMSSLHYSLTQRMRDCVEILSQTGTDDAAACATLLTTMLLTEDEGRLTNSMANAQDHHLFMETEDARGGLLGGGKKKTPGMGVDSDFENPLSINSADQARIMLERLAVLSVAQNDTLFRKFEGKTNDKTSKSRRKRSGREADLDGFDFRGETKSTQEVVAATINVSDTSSVKSGASKLQLKQPKKDTAKVTTTKSRQGAVPALMASNKDTGGRTRRQSMEQGARSRPAVTSRPSIDTFQSNFSVENGNSTNFSNQRSMRSLESGSGSRHRSTHFDPFAPGSNETGSVTSDNSSSRRTGASTWDNADMNMDAGFGGDAFGPDMAMAHVAQRKSVGHIGDVPRVQVNVALNEDLTCFYKLSKMSSCSVEGVIQVQVKTNAEEAPPFYLTIRDPSSHIMSIQENKKFAEDMGDTIRHEPPSRRPDHKFNVLVPKGDNYFPVMRYKCGSDLRPVPIVSVPESRRLLYLLLSNILILRSVFKLAYDWKVLIGELHFR